MGEPKRMHQVTQVVHDETGQHVLYGPGELHAPGSLPANVPYTEVLADEAYEASAPAHAQDADRADVEAEKAREFERIQTERSQPRVSDGRLGTDPVSADDPTKAEVSEQQSQVQPGSQAAQQDAPAQAQPTQAQPTQAQPSARPAAGPKPGR